MHIPPLLRSLTRHKLTVALMLLATGLTCAIVTNLASMIVHRLALLSSPSGLDEPALVMVNSSQVNPVTLSHDNSDRDLLAQYQADMAALRGIAGVRSVAEVSGLPMYGGMGIDITAKSNAPEGTGFQVTAFNGSQGELTTLGLRLVQGRDFLPTEYIPADGFNGLSKVSAAIVSRALAERLFHTKDPVGRLFYTSNHPVRIVGVVEHLMGMSPQLGASDNEYAMLLPLNPNGDDVTYLVRTAPKDRDRVLRQVTDLLGSRDPLGVQSDAMTFTQLRTNYFRRDSAMVGLLLATGISLLIVTAAGIAGLASFWVRQRTRSIGIRRAVGATRADVLRYFHAENLLIVTGGVLLGCILAYALNLLTMKYYALRVLPPGYLVVGTLAMWLTGQLAVLGPALRASRVPPAVATRSV